MDPMWAVMIPGALGWGWWMEQRMAQLTALKDDVAEVKADVKSLMLALIHVEAHDEGIDQARREVR